MEQVIMTSCGKEVKSLRSKKAHERMCKKCIAIREAIAEKEDKEMEPQIEKPELTPQEEAKLRLFQWIRALNGRRGGTQGEMKRMHENYLTITGKNFALDYSCGGCCAKIFKECYAWYQAEAVEFFKKYE